jgi:hypothetical protein
MRCDFCGEDCFDKKRLETKTLIRAGMSGYEVTEGGNIVCCYCVVDVCADCGAPLWIHFGVGFAEMRCPVHGTEYSRSLRLGRDYRKCGDPESAETFKRYCQIIVRQN